jgi:hypothetical protein
MLIELSNWIDFEKSVAKLNSGERLLGIFQELISSGNHFS